MDYNFEGALLVLILKRYSGFKKGLYGVEEISVKNIVNLKVLNLTYLFVQ